MLRLFLAMLAYVWGAFLAPDDGDGSDDAKDGGNDNGDKPSSDKPPSDAKWSDKDVNKLKGDARKEGRSVGEKNVLETLGFDSIDEAKQRFATFKEWEEDEKTELDKAADCIDKLTKRAETAESRVSELEGTVKSHSRKEAIRAALSKAGYSGNERHALRAVSESDVKESDDGTFDATDAVKALSEEGFPGFESEESKPEWNDPPTLERRRRKQSGEGETASDRRKKKRTARLGANPTKGKPAP